MQRLLIFIIIFCYIYPVYIKYLPIPLDRVLQLGGIMLLCLNLQDFKKIISTKVLWRFTSVTFILLFLAILAQLQKIGELETYFIKEIFDTFLYLSSAYLIYWALKKTYSTINFGLVVYYITLAALVQTFISFIFFIENSIFDLYLGMIKEETNQGLFARTSTISKRFIGFGSQFFSGVIKYGIAFFSVLILPYLYPCRLTNNKLLYWLSVIFIALGGILTGRTFFVAIILGIIMLVFLKSSNFLSFTLYNIKAFIVILILASIVIIMGEYFIVSEQFDIVYRYVFELFLNFFNEGELSTTSSDATLSMFIYPDTLSTWLYGDGKMLERLGGYYMATDVGYIRLIFYFGLPSTLFLIYVIYKYSKLIISLTNDRVIKYLIMFITFWMLVLNFKGLAFEMKYYVLFIIILIFEKKSSKLCKIN